MDFIEETGRALSRLSASTFRLAEPPLTPPPAHIDIAHEASSNRDTAVGDGPEAKEKKLRDVRYALAEMQHKLLREFLLTVALASGAVTLREFYFGTSAGLALTMTIVSLTVWLISFKRRLGAIVMFPVFLTLVLVFHSAAVSRGGATASTLALAFFPGFLAILVLGPALGVVIAGAMLLSFGWLAWTTELPTLVQRLRFSDEVAMTVFAAGLAYTLHRSFRAYERVIEARNAELSRLKDERRKLTQTIYDELEPNAHELVLAASANPSLNKEQTAAFQEVLSRLIGTLRKAKVLARHDSKRPEQPVDPDRSIRVDAVRTWLRLGALLMLFFAVRNAMTGAAYIPALAALTLSLLMERWLQKPHGSRLLESTAFMIGVLALGPLSAQIVAYGATPDAPALVLMPGAVLLVVLLSRGPAAFFTLALYASILLWVGLRAPLYPYQERLLTNLLLSFVVIVFVVGRLLSLRTHYSRTLLEQEESLQREMAQHRRLAGTLFHDASNNLQAIALSLDGAEPDAQSARLLSLSRRVERLITLSKHFLLDAGREPKLTAYSLSDAFSLLREAFEPHLDAKGLRLTISGAVEPHNPAPLALAEPVLLVESVLGNLVSNAIKFSPEGSAIAVSADEVGDEVRISIRDWGPGLPDDVLAQLDREGASPSSRGTAGERGQGFGLKLAREHVERMGGSLELARASDGTECIVKLKRAQSGSAPMTA